MTVSEKLRNVLAVYHKRNEIYDKGELDIPGFGSYIREGSSVRNKPGNDNVLIITSVSRKRFSEPGIHFISGEGSITIKKLKDGSYVFTRIAKKFLDVHIPVPTDLDEYFNLVLQHEITLSFEDARETLKAMNQINHTVGVKMKL